MEGLEVKVGIIGPVDLVNESIEMSKQYNFIDTVGIPYEDEKDTLDYIKNGKIK